MILALKSNIYPQLRLFLFYLITFFAVNTQLLVISLWKQKLVQRDVYVVALTVITF